MISLAYDETSGFESEKGEAAFIAGIIYDSKSEKEYDGVLLEQARIEAFYRAACTKCWEKNLNVRFPRDLHVTRKKTNRKEVSLLKDAVNNSLQEFIQKGTYKGQELLFLDKEGKLAFQQEKGFKPVPRKGEYQFVIIQKGEDKDIENCGEVYSGMVKSLIQKSLYLNSSLKIKNQNVKINAPTRVLPNEELNDSIRQQYTNRGYRYEMAQDMWFVMDAGKLQGIVDECERTIASLKPILFIKKIKEGYDDEGKARNFSFLFLADTICSYIKDEEKEIIASKKSANDYAEVHAHCVRNLYPSPKNRVYIFDETTQKIDSINLAIFEKNCFDAASGLFDCRDLKEKNCEMKNQAAYLKAVEKSMDKEMTVKMLRRAVKDLDAYRLHQKEGIAFRADKLKYIFGYLLKVTKKLESQEKSVPDDLKATLYDIGISAHTHMGEPKEALKYYDLYLKTKGLLDNTGNWTDDFHNMDDASLEATVRLMTVYHDCFNYEEAEKVGCKILNIHSKKSFMEIMVNRIRDLILQRKSQTGIKKNLKLRPVYKAASSLGQTYAFMENPAAEKFFNEVLDNLYDQGSLEQGADYNITAAYCLQWYIESGNQKEYERLARIYFGENEKLPDQLNYLLVRGKREEKEENSSFSLEYALLVYIKAFYKFYKDQKQYHELLVKMTHIEETVSGYCDQIKNHPWEIIFKYAALLEEYDKSAIAGKNIKLAKEAVKECHIEVIDLILRYGEIEYREDRISHGHKNQNSQESLERRINELWNLIKKQENVPLKWTSKDGDATFRREKMGKIFTFMYH